MMMATHNLELIRAGVRTIEMARGQIVFDSAEHLDEARRTL